MKKTVKIEGMMCEHCKAHVYKALLGIDGVSDVAVSLESGTAELVLDKEVGDDIIAAVVAEAGYKVAD